MNKPLPNFYYNRRCLQVLLRNPDSHDSRTWRCLTFIYGVQMELGWYIELSSVLISQLYPLHTEQGECDQCFPPAAVLRSCCEHPPAPSLAASSGCSAALCKPPSAPAAPLSFLYWHHTAQDQSLRTFFHQTGFNIYLTGLFYMKSLLDHFPGFIYCIATAKSIIIYITI